MEKARDTAIEVVASQGLAHAESVIQALLGVRVAAVSRD
jgi:hypothetical protein